ncbi:MAG: (d)CMP kinase [Calditrichaeota bacterium]|nr:(d)CMP kinase [Calditrichota bacterium]
MSKDSNVIAIDGPAGSGKSTTARLLARKLGFLYLDTGAMYRALTLKALRRRIDLDSETELEILFENTSIDLLHQNGRLRVLLDGEDVSREIRSAEVSDNVSRVAAKKAVRERMALLQREFAQKGNVIAEGRDIGTVIFPDAKLKIFLVASIEERARRRFKEGNSPSESAKLKEMAENLKKRDEADSGREHSPLLKAADAIEVDTTALTIEQQVDLIAQLWEKKKSEDETRQ